MKYTFNAVSAPLKMPYIYARGRDLTCSLVQVQLASDDVVGRGEGAPLESFFNVPSGDTLDQLDAIRPEVEAGIDREGLLELLPACPARNAVDAALWDFEAKRAGVPVWELLGVEPRPIENITTISLAEPEQFRLELEASRGQGKLKLKLGSANDVERLELVREIRPDATVVVDVNCAWDLATFAEMLPILTEHRVEMIEQPVPESEEAGLAEISRSIVVIADESFTDEDDLDRVAGLYDGINIKLDKCGGLTAALRIVDRARQAGLRVMIGCIPASSLSMAAGYPIGVLADYVDLGGHLLLSKDVQPAIAWRDGWLEPPSRELWG